MNRTPTLLPLIFDIQRKSSKVQESRLNVNMLWYKELCRNVWRLPFEMFISKVSWNSLVKLTSQSFLSIGLAEGCILNYTRQNCIVLKVEIPTLLDPMVLLKICSLTTLTLNSVN